MPPRRYLYAAAARLGSVPLTLLDGRVEHVALPAGATVKDLRAFAMRASRQGFLRLLDASGAPLDPGALAVKATAVRQDYLLAANRESFAVAFPQGVAAWGVPRAGGESQPELKGVKQIEERAPKAKAKPNGHHQHNINISTINIRYILPKARGP